VRALAKELGPANIRINLVAAGVLETGISNGLSAPLRAAYTKFSAMGRVGRASEVAAGIVQLGLHNPVMTGSVLHLDGGI
jgi:3-oxoacyl-[acyl-carrier protein] reductase